MGSCYQVVNAMLSTMRHVDGPLFFSSTIKTPKTLQDCVNNLDSAHKYCNLAGQIINVWSASLVWTIHFNMSATAGGRPKPKDGTVSTK